jgi:hypothetical protein
MPYYDVCIKVPEKVLRKMEEIEIKYGIRKEDILLRALYKVLNEEFR